ncbi:MAG: hypothetical protein KBT34_09855 [Prevotella sp.]|nr:hypothetical protein [Candidatus Prevotella equi]
MSNPLYNSLAGSMPQNNNMMQMIQQFQQFKQNLQGDPKQIVMNMLSNGQISQAQLNQAQQMANQLRGILK